MVKGTKIGNYQRWKYLPGSWQEQKIGRDKKGRGKWRFNYKVDKIQNRKGHFPKNGMITWKINAIQKVRKLPGYKNRYKTEMIGTKKLIYLKIPKNKRR